MWAWAGAACSDDDNFRDSIIDVTPEQLTELDQWIRDSFGVYNIDVIYKWNGFEVNQEYDLTPVREEKVIPCLSVIRRIWMNPYRTLGGELFFKKSSPKQIMLIGSAVYLEDGNSVVGEAEQGNRITLYDLNQRNPKDSLIVRQYMHTFHHEYIHILHQLVKYPTAYEELGGGQYTINWANATMNQALGAGFITPYAMENANEDFAEMIARFIISTEAEWQVYFNQAQSQSAEGYRKLREKETIALQYMQGVWGIDLYLLRELVLREFDRILAENRAEQQQP